AIETSPRGVVSRGAGGVAGRGEGNRLDPQLHGPRDGGRHAPRLETGRWIERLIFDEQPRKPRERSAGRASQEWRIPFTQRDSLVRLVDRQDVPELPHRTQCPPADDLGSKSSAKRCQIVPRDQRFRAFCAQIVQPIDWELSVTRGAVERI